jgi:PAS domain S-box-containing protein
MKRKCVTQPEGISDIGYFNELYAGVRTEDWHIIEAYSGSNRVDELAALKEENRNLLSRHEDIVAKANALTVEAETARLEFSQVFDAIGDAFCVIDTKKTVQRINERCVELFGLKEKKEAVGRKCYELFPSKLCQTEKCLLRCVRYGSPRVEMDLKISGSKDRGREYLLTCTPLTGLAREFIGAVVQYKDITMRKRYEAALQKANKKLEELAALDGLTKLANRRAFDDTLQKEWLRMRRSRQPLSLIFGDIDYFKSYNDYYGHQQGDVCRQKGRPQWHYCQ